MNLVPLPHYGTARTVNVGQPFGTTASSEANDSAAQKSKTYFLRMHFIASEYDSSFFQQFCYHCYYRITHHLQTQRCFQNHILNKKFSAFCDNQTHGLLV